MSRPAGHDQPTSSHGSCGHWSHLHGPRNRVMSRDHHPSLRRRSSGQAGGEQALLPPASGETRRIPPTQGCLMMPTHYTDEWQAALQAGEPRSRSPRTPCSTQSPHPLVLRSEEVVLAAQNTCPLAGGHHSRIV